MAYPPAYVRAYSFTDFETTNPGEPKPGNKLDTEYDAVSNALTATQTSLALIQRADGELANESVGVDQLQAGLFDAIGDAAVADAEAAAAAAAASASAAAGSASSASSSASAASASAATASGAAAQAGVSQGIAQNAANEAALSAADSFDSAQISANAGNEAQGFRNEAEGFTDLAFKWAEYLTGPVMPAPPGWPEAVDDGMFSSKWWAIRARDYNSVHEIDLGSGQADIGAAFDEWDLTNDLPTGLIYATWGVPPLTYVLTDPGNPSDASSWTLISGGPGPPGPGNSLTIGTVTTGAVGQPADATITGVSPNQVLNLTLPTGATGPAGPTGVAGPPNALAIGTVTTGAPGSPAAATITGTAPSQTLNLTIPQGPQGIQGIQGIQGPPGAGLLADPSALVGLTAVPGTSLAAIRADGAPALSQAITPTWTGLHNFTSAAGAAGGAFQVVSNAPTYVMWVMSQAVNARAWFTQGAGNNYFLGIIDDGVSVVKTALQITRAVTTVTNLSFGNATDNPTYNFLGTGTTTFSGRIVGAPPNFEVLRGVGPSATITFFDAAQTIRSGYLQFDTTAGGLLNSEQNLPLTFRTNNLVRVTIAADGTVTSTGVIRGPDGSAAAPTYSWTNDPDTGVFSGGANILSMSVGGGTRLAIDTTRIRPVLVIQGEDGTAALPAYSFDSDSNTGIYRNNPDSVAFAAGGIFAGTFAINGSGGAGLYLPSGAAGLPPLSFLGDGDTGLFRPGADALGFATAGVEGARITPTGSLQITGGYSGGTGVRPVAALEICIPTASRAQLLAYNRATSLYMSLDLQATYTDVTGYGGAQAAGDLWLGGKRAFTNFNDGTLYINYSSQYSSIQIAGPTVFISAVSAPSFTSTSSRTIKRVTGAPRRAADLLARLRPLLYRLLDGDDHEQLGLIAEEVHEVCPQLSDGKAVAYDRLAILLLAAWQDEHAEAA